MRKIILLILLININICYSQIKNGKYIDKEGRYLVINNKFTEFVLPPPNSSNHLEIMDRGYSGHGNIIINDTEIIIKPKVGYFKGSNSIYKFIPDSIHSGIFKFIIYDNANKLLSSHSTLTYDQFERYEGKPGAISFWTNDKSEVELKIVKPIDSIITILNSGYQSLRIKLSNLDGGTYIVNIVPGHLLYNNLEEIVLRYTKKRNKIYFKYLKYGDLDFRKLKLPIYYFYKEHKRN
jgi:hypothetical protein